MAKVLIEFDTKDKSLSVTLDGQPVANVVEATIQSCYLEPGYRCMILTRTEDEASDITTYTQTTAQAIAKFLGR